MASLPKASFCSKQCEHQKAPYILAPAAFRRFASSTARGGDDVSTTGLYAAAAHRALWPFDRDP